MQKILITGGAGFIGSHLAQHHLEKGDAVFCIDNLTTGSESNFSEFKNSASFTFKTSDILTMSDLDQAVSWATRIYHLAAIVGVYRVLENPVDVLSVNVGACERVLQAASVLNKPPRIIIASSSEVYGLGAGALLSEKAKLIVEPDFNGRACYAMSKLANEAFSLAYNKKAHLPVTVVRLFNTIGERQSGRYGMVVPRFISQALKNEPLTIYGDGKQTRSFGNVKDVVMALDKLADNHDSVGEIINVGSDEEVSIHFLAELVIRLTKSQSKIEYIPYEKAYGIFFEDIKQRRPDLKKLRQYIDFQPSWTLEKTIKDLIQ